MVRKVRLPLPGIKPIFFIIDDSCVTRNIGNVQKATLVGHRNGIWVESSLTWVACARDDSQFTMTEVLDFTEPKGRKTY